jgi:hypothetical protein
MSFVVKEMCLKRQVLVMSPLDPVYESPQVRDHRHLGGHALFQESDGEKHSGGQRFSRHGERFFG